MSRPRKPFGVNHPGRLPSTMLKVLAAELSEPTRLRRGKAYARDGSVLDIDIAPGSVVVEIQGSRATPYVATIDVRPGDGMPLKRDISSHCTCPDDDWSGSVCKHVVAALFALANEVLLEPELLDVWRDNSNTATGAPIASDGAMPDGPVPDGPVPDGPVPDGTVPDGTVPDGTVPGRSDSTADRLDIARRHLQLVTDRFAAGDGDGHGGSDGDADGEPDEPQRPSEERIDQEEWTDQERWDNDGVRRLGRRRVRPEPDASQLTGPEPHEIDPLLAELAVPTGRTIPPLPAVDIAEQHLPRQPELARILADALRSAGLRWQ